MRSCMTVVVPIVFWGLLLCSALPLWSLGSAHSRVEVPLDTGRAISLGDCNAVRAALVDLYQACNGPEWTGSSGWLGEYTPICGWKGVRCAGSPLGDSCVILDLSLPNNNLRGTVPSSLFDIGIFHMDLSGNELSISTNAQLVYQGSELLAMLANDPNVLQHLQQWGATTMSYNFSYNVLEGQAENRYWFSEDSGLWFAEHFVLDLSHAQHSTIPRHTSTTSRAISVLEGPPAPRNVVDVFFNDNTGSNPVVDAAQVLDGDMFMTLSKMRIVDLSNTGLSGVLSSLTVLQTPNLPPSHPFSLVLDLSRNPQLALNGKGLSFSESLYGSAYWNGAVFQGLILDGLNATGSQDWMPFTRLNRTFSCNDCGLQGYVHDLLNWTGCMPNSTSNNRTSLKTVRLRGNRIEGPFPLITEQHSWDFLDLSGNLVEGPLAGDWFHLGSTLLANNKIRSELPKNAFASPYLHSTFYSSRPALPSKAVTIAQHMGGLALLSLSSRVPKYVDLSGNRLYGTLNQTHFGGTDVNFTKLWVNGAFSERVLALIDLSHNELSGMLPRGLLRELCPTTLNLSHNNFSGVLSPALEPATTTLMNKTELLSLSFVGVDTIVLSHNRFVGELPLFLNRTTVQSRAIASVPFRRLHFDWNDFNGSVWQWPLLTNGDKVILRTLAPNLEEWTVSHNPQLSGTFFEAVILARSSLRVVDMSSTQVHGTVYVSAEYDSDVTVTVPRGGWTFNFSSTRVSAAVISAYGQVHVDRAIHVDATPSPQYWVNVSTAREMHGSSVFTAPGVALFGLAYSPFKTSGKIWVSGTNDFFGYSSQGQRRVNCPSQSALPPSIEYTDLHLFPLLLSPVASTLSGVRQSPLLYDEDIAPQLALPYPWPLTFKPTPLLLRLALQYPGLGNGTGAGVPSAECDAPFFAQNPMFRLTNGSLRFASRADDPHGFDLTPVPDYVCVSANDTLYTVALNRKYLKVSVVSKEEGSTVWVGNLDSAHSFTVVSRSEGALHERQGDGLPSLNFSSALSNPDLRGKFFKPLVEQYMRYPTNSTKSTAPTLSFSSLLFYPLSGRLLLRGSKGPASEGFVVPLAAEQCESEQCFYRGPSGTSAVADGRGEYAKVSVQTEVSLDLAAETLLVVEKSFETLRKGAQLVPWISWQRGAQKTFFSRHCPELCAPRHQIPCAQLQPVSMLPGQLFCAVIPVPRNLSRSEEERNTTWLEHASSLVIELETPPFGYPDRMSVTFWKDPLHGVKATRNRIQIQKLQFLSSAAVPPVDGCYSLLNGTHILEAVFQAANASLGLSVPPTWMFSPGVVNAAPSREPTLYSFGAVDAVYCIESEAISFYTSSDVPPLVFQARTCAEELVGVVPNVPKLCSVADGFVWTLEPSPESTDPYRLSRRDFPSLHGLVATSVGKAMRIRMGDRLLSAYGPPKEVYNIREFLSSQGSRNIFPPFQLNKTQDSASGFWDPAAAALQISFFNSTYIFSAGACASISAIPSCDDILFLHSENHPVDAAQQPEVERITSSDHAAQVTIWGLSAPMQSVNIDISPEDRALTFLLPTFAPLYHDVYASALALPNPKAGTPSDHRNCPTFLLKCVARGTETNGCSSSDATELANSFLYGIWTMGVPGEEISNCYPQSVCSASSAFGEVYEYVMNEGFSSKVQLSCPQQSSSSAAAPGAGNASEIFVLGVRSWRPNFALTTIESGVPSSFFHATFTCSPCLPYFKPGLNPQPFILIAFASLKSLAMVIGFFCFMQYCPRAARVLFRCYAAVLAVGCGFRSPEHKKHFRHIVVDNYMPRKMSIGALRERLEDLVVAYGRTTRREPGADRSTADDGVNVGPFGVHSSLNFDDVSPQTPTSADGNENERHGSASPELSTNSRNSLSTSFVRRRHTGARGEGQGDTGSDGPSTNSASSALVHQQFQVHEAFAEYFAVHLTCNGSVVPLPARSNKKEVGKVVHDLFVAYRAYHDHRASLEEEKRKEENAEREGEEGRGGASENSSVEHEIEENRTEDEGREEGQSLLEGASTKKANREEYRYGTDEQRASTLPPPPPLGACRAASASILREEGELPLASMRRAQTAVLIDEDSKKEKSHRTVYEAEQHRLAEVASEGPRKPQRSASLLDDRSNSQRAAVHQHVSAELSRPLLQTEGKKDHDGEGKPPLEEQEQEQDRNIEQREKRNEGDHSPDRVSAANAKDSGVSRPLKTERERDHDEGKQQPQLQQQEQQDHEVSHELERPGESDDRSSLRGRDADAKVEDEGRRPEPPDATNKKDRAEELRQGMYSATVACREVLAASRTSTSEVVMLEHFTVRQALTPVPLVLMVNAIWLLVLIVVAATQDAPAAAALVSAASPVAPVVDKALQWYQTLFFVVCNSTVTTTLLVNSFFYSVLRGEYNPLRNKFFVLALVAIAAPFLTHCLIGLTLFAPVFVVPIVLPIALELFANRTINRLQHSRPALCFILGSASRVVLIFAGSVLLSASFNYSASFFYDEESFWTETLHRDYKARSVVCLLFDLYATWSQILQSFGSVVGTF